MSEVAAAGWEAVVDVHKGSSALRRAGDAALAVVGAVLGDPSSGPADVVVRRLDDHVVELFRLECKDPDDAAQLVSEVRADLDTMTAEELSARWEPLEDDD